MKAITGVTLIDGTGDSPVENATVLVNDDRIELVVAAESVQIPPDTEVIDASGLTMLPGLIDCHDHLASFGYELASRWGLTESRSLRHMRIASVLKQTLESGYTTVRDAGRLDAASVRQSMKDWYLGRGFRLRSASSRQREASATTLALLVTVILRHLIPHCHQALQTGLRPCAPKCVRWCVRAQTLSRQRPLGGPAPDKASGQRIS